MLKKLRGDFIRVLLVGSGAREHAIAEAICRSKGAELFAYMGNRNPGIIRLAKESIIGDILNGEEIARWAKERNIDLGFPASDPVLEAGVTDALVSAGIPCASPTRDAARIEWDKSFCRKLMKKYGIKGSPRFGVFSDPKEASSFIDELTDVAIKPSGLTGGKGVKVTGEQLKDKEEAKGYAAEILEKKIGGIPSVVVEEKLVGEEFSLQAFVDGKNVVGMPAVQDHKKAYAGDTGPNTGGMGSYSDVNHLLPFLTKEDYDEAMGIMRKTVSSFEKETGKQYKGILYGGFMATKDGVYVIEFNSRFGDPEAMNVLPILKSDFVEILKKMEKGELKESDVLFEKKATVCKYIVPEGYPGASITDQPLSIDGGGIGKTGARVYYASVDEKEGTIYTKKSRSMGILGVGDSIGEAERIAEKGASFVKGRVRHRNDIGTKELIQKRIDHMKELRGV